MADDSLPDLSPAALSRLVAGMTTDEVEAIVGRFHRPNLYEGREYFAWIGHGGMLRAFFNGPGRTLSAAVLDLAEAQRPLYLGPDRRRRTRQATVMQTWYCIPCRQRNRQSQSGRPVICSVCGSTCERAVGNIRVPSPKHTKAWDQFWVQYKAKTFLHDGLHMNGPFLIQIDEAKFADIPNKVVPRTVRLKDPTFETPQAREWIFGGYCEKLLYKNDKLSDMLQQFLGRLDNPECWNRLTEGQRILYSLAALDGQVKNGGITQFFWNCPDLIFPASDALAALKYSDLSVAFEKALEKLIGKKDKWVELRNQESFQATYDLLELNWFDDAYFEQYGPMLIALLVKYVRENKAEFIEQ